MLLPLEVESQPRNRNKLPELTKSDRTNGMAFEPSPSPEVGYFLGS